MRREPSSRVSRGRRLAFYALATIVPAAALFVALEAGGRAYIHVKYGVPGKSYGLWRSDRVLGARHRENGYNTHTQTNDFGFKNREPVHEPKLPGALRVIAYGGSTTFCYNLSDADAWPAQLEDLVRERSSGRRHQVLNGGAILWSLGHAYARAQGDLPRLAPDVVIIYSGINEHTNAEMLAAGGAPMQELVEAGDYGRFATNLDQNRWAKRHLVSVRFLDYVIKRRFRGLLGNAGADATPETPSSPDPAVLSNYLHVLGRFLDLSAAHNARVVFVIQADAGGNARNTYLTSYSRAGAELARDKGVQVVDARRVVTEYPEDPKDLFYVTGVHYSALGASRLAELLYEEIFASDV